MPFHILAKREDIAERAIVVGDPGRARFVAQKLSNARLVNEHRGLLTYTGSWKGKQVTISTHGMGGAGASIIFEELIQLGVKVLIRLGTTGGIRRGVKVGDIVIPTAAMHPPGGIYGMYAGSICPSPAPDFQVLKLLVEEAEKAGVKPWVAPVFSSDAFYVETEKLAEQWAELGAVSVEMECATLFMIARLRGARAGALLLVNGSLVENVDRLVLEKKLKGALDKAVEIALNALVRV